MEALEWPGQKKYNKAKMQDLGLDENDDTKIGSYKTSGNFTFIRIAKAGHMVRSILSYYRDENINSSFQVPFNQPLASLSMLNRWIDGKWY